MEALDQIDAECAEMLLQEIPSNVEFASTMVLPDGRSRGQQFDQLSPPQACFLQALDQGATSVALTKPVQDGATTAGLVPFFRRAIKQRQTVLLCYPTGDTAKDIWTTKVQPILEAYGGQEPESGGGSNGGAARVMTLPSGGRFALRAAGGRGESGQAALTGDAMLIDEVDDWESKHRVLLMLKRMTQSADPLVVFASTVKRDVDSIMLSLHDDGTKSHLEFPCPHCGAFQAMSWEQVELENCGYRCAHCPKVWTEMDRRVALAAWRRVDEQPERWPFVSLRWSCLDSTLTTMRQEISGTPALPGYLSALRHLEDFGDHSEMRSFVRDRLSLPYLGDAQLEEDGGKPLSAAILSRRSRTATWATVVTDLEEGKLWSRYCASEVPERAIGAVLAIDVQGDRIYWSAVLFDARGTTWDFAWGQERWRMRTLPDGTMEPEPWGPGELSLTLDRVRDLRPSLTNLPFFHCVVDTGYEGEELAKWLRANPTWRGIRGVDSIPKSRPVAVRDILAYDMQWCPGLGRWEVVTEAVRERVHNAYRKGADEPGAALLPAGLGSGDHYLRHLCSWILVTDEKTKRTKWVRKQRRDDHLDTRTYAHALIILEIERKNAPPPPPRQFGVVGKVGS